MQQKTVPEAEFSTAFAGAAQRLCSEGVDVNVIWSQANRTELNSVKLVAQMQRHWKAGITSRKIVRRGRRRDAVGINIPHRK